MQCFVKTINPGFSLLSFYGNISDLLRDLLSWMKEFLAGGSPCIIYVIKLICHFFVCRILIPGNGFSGLGFLNQIELLNLKTLIKRSALIIRGATGKLQNF